MDRRHGLTFRISLCNTRQLHSENTSAPRENATDFTTSVTPLRTESVTLCCANRFKGGQHREVRVEFMRCQALCSASWEPIALAIWADLKLESRTTRPAGLSPPTYFNAGEKTSPQSSFRARPTVHRDCVTFIDFINICAICSRAPWIPASDMVVHCTTTNVITATCSVPAASTPL